MPRGYYPTASRWERRGAVYVRRRQSPAHLYQAVHRAFSTIRLLGRAGRQVRWSGHSFHTGGHVFPAAAQAGPANRAPACGDRPAAGPVTGWADSDTRTDAREGREKEGENCREDQLFPTEVGQMRPAQD